MKDNLMEEVWGDTIVEENNLDKKISALRKILGERDIGGKEKFIETVRGHGFRFVAEVRRIDDLGFRISDFKAKVATATSALRRMTNQQPKTKNPTQKTA